MSNCALVRILMLRFMIPYASTKVNSYVMKFISYLWCIIQCYLCLMLGYEILHESTTKVLGMPRLEMKNEFTLCCQIINSMESVGMEGTRGYG